MEIQIAVAWVEGVERDGGGVGERKRDRRFAWGPPSPFSSIAEWTAAGGVSS